MALLLFMVGLEFSLGDFWLARRTVLMAGALQMIAVAPPLILLLMWLGQPGQSAALLGTAAATSSTALVSRQLADQGELTTRHGRSAIAVLVFQDLASVPLLALLAIWARGESPKIEHVLLEVFGVLLLFTAAALVSRRLLHGLLGWVARRGHEGIVRARLLVRGGGCRRCCARGRRIRRPGGLPRRDGAGRERLPAPHGKPPQAVSRCVVGRVLRDHRPATGRSTDSFGTAGGAGVAGGAGTSQDPAQYAGLAGDAPVRPRCLAHGHSVGARRRVRPAVVGHGLAAASDPRDRRPTHAGRAGAQHGPGTATDPPSRCTCPVLSRTGGVIQPPQAEEVEIAAQTTRYRDHVIVCGAGELGLTVSEILRHAGVAHLLLEADAQKVEAARAAGAPVFHGDASRPDTLLAAGLTHAHLVVLTFAHAQQALRIAQAIAERRPALTLWVSCRSTTADDAFRAMPNVRVYQQSFAAAIGLAEQVMSTLGMSTELIEGHISAMRRRLDSSRFPGSSSS